MTLASPFVPPPQIDLSGRVALVTGGANGIGQACAAALRTAGAKVVIADRRFPQTNAGNDESVQGILCDVSDETYVESMFAKVLQNYGQLDMLINSAGVIEQVNRTIDQGLDD